ncbi:ribonuclease T2-like [Pristis pectinata]|uniref:ribonuclease T2-like n=1 Tax=Pristis pectinata TaxID=685728 RepID=UPI00223D97F4|nr:ribonuclease T2-like [Pristis pectinata]XP_051869170.1 ribonuclease T2-like [Pristis pectinata]XP_051869171.1 ribonuclease T2-like [Pristis pectinata]XP_051869172.1 ribonuclease T2-like [Pristis pectinata]
MASHRGSRNLRDPMLAWTFLPLLVALILPETSDCANHPWHSFVFSQQWPQTVCLMASETCKVPLTVDYWTIHGLWPKRIQMCNNSWHFDIKNVQDILSDLEHWWPDVIHPNSTQLWKHEWQKHGTCAATLESLDSQKKYFSKALELFKQLDLNSVLEKANILPSSKYYMVENIEDALVSVYGVTPKIQCLFPTQGASVQTLGQIEFCFTKQFQLFNCTETAPNLLVSEEDRQQNMYLKLGVCDRNMQVSYPPIEHLY